jgi:hypothetical protein
MEDSNDELQFTMPSQVLYLFVTQILKWDLSEINLSQYQPHGLSNTLCLLYELSRVHEKGIVLFQQQDRLIPFAELTLDKDHIEVITENQGNWKARFQLNNPILKLDSGTQIEEFQIDDFLSTFAFQEITFGLPYRFGIHFTNVRDLFLKFQTIVPIYLKAPYHQNELDFYIVDGDSILMAGSMWIFATQNAEKYTHYRKIIDSYTF